MKYFGTDGIRGKVGEKPINPQFVLRLGWAIGHVFRREDRHARVLIGKDTRLSGYILESALQAGLAAAGADITLLGPMPTPAIAYLTRTFSMDVGVVISASHNPYMDNGIKLFSTAGIKLDDNLERAIEKQLAKEIQMVASPDLGRAARIMDARGRYIEFCKSTIPRELDISGFKLVLDCANGATYSIAPRVFSELGMRVKVINREPDGININHNCGSTHPATILAATRREKAALGIAFDGDGDRVIMCDAKGHIVDGDIITYILARYMRDTGMLKGEVVGTIMSNYGLERSLNELGIKMKRVPVGDRYIISELIEKETGNLGGESSGHVVCTRHTTTGDGMVAALQTLAALKHYGVSLQQMTRAAGLIPVERADFASSHPKRLAQSEAMRSAIRRWQSEMGEEGRILVRPSGTEPLLRMMVETTNTRLRTGIIADLKKVAAKANARL